MPRQRTGFTLIELLVVVAVLALLLCLVIPAVQSARETARRGQCKDNMREIALAMHQYHDTNFCFPPGWHGGNGFAWGMSLISYRGFASIYNHVDFFKVATSSAGVPPQRNIDHIRIALSLFKCPSANDSQTVSSSRRNGTGDDFKFRLAEAAVANYLGNAGTSLTDGGDVRLFPSGWKRRRSGRGSRRPAQIPEPAKCRLRRRPRERGRWIPGGVLYEDSHITISDISDGTAHTALFAEHYGETCRTGGGNGNPNCTSSDVNACFAYWANADSYTGGNGATVASDVCFSSVIGINGSAQLGNRRQRRRQLAARKRSSRRLMRRHRAAFRQRHRSGTVDQDLFPSRRHASSPCRCNKS